MQNKRAKRLTFPALLLAALWLVAVDNLPYWRLVIENASSYGWPFLASLGVFTLAAIVLFLSVLTFARVTRYVLVAILCVSAAATWFMNAYGIMIDREMIENVFQTDRVEALELLNPRLVFSVMLFGVAPSIVVWKLLPKRQPLGLALREKGAVISIALITIAVAVAPLYKDYASFFRNNREIRFLVTPVNYIRGVYSYARDRAETPGIMTPIGTDAHKGDMVLAHDRPAVGVVVVGETVRAANLSLYGYDRSTTPLLEERPLIRFDEVAACGTSTVVSLPCMFSDIGHDGFKRSAASSREGLLDVLSHAGLDTVWLDNNSGCKGACRSARVWSPDDLDIDGLCEDGECFDAVLLDRLDAELDSVSDDTVVILHMNGSHGPSYYRRYPDAFRVFTPDCHSDELTDCSQEEIRNSYDNTIRYADWFLDEVIDRLERRSASLDTTLLYVSDHGESLGEYGLYLHGTPYFIAPEEQTRVPMFLWLSRPFEANFALDRKCLETHAAHPSSHDNLFHSVLGMMDVTTSVRHDELNVFAGCSKEQAPPITSAKGETTYTAP